MQVFEEQDERRATGEHVERFHQLAQHPVARRPLRPALHGLQIAVGHERRQLRQPRRRVLREELHQRVASGLSAQSSERLEHGQIGLAGAVLLHALAPPDA